MAEARRSGAGQGSPSGGRGGRGKSGQGKSGQGKSGQGGSGRGRSSQDQGRKGQSSRGSGSAGGGRSGGAKPRTGGRSATGASTGASTGGRDRRGGASGGRASGGGRPTTDRAASRATGGRPSSNRAARGQGAGRADTRQGGFGPYSVDQRDEETRAKRDEPRGRGRDHRGRRDDESPEETRGPRRPALRVVGTRKPPSGSKASGARKKPPTKRGAAKQAQGASARTRRRRRGPAGVQEELAQLAGRDSARALGTLMAAADAYGNDREREAIRILRPLRDRLPDSPSVRELMGLAQYRVGNYNAAAKELEAYRDLSGEVDQHPVLMDCYRAQHRWKKVSDLWEELAAVSPSAEVVTEGRIVCAGAFADQGRLPDALALLRKRGDMVRQPKDHHLRLWYALADLEERAGNLARARELFHQVARVEPGFADVAERLAALG